MIIPTMRFTSPIIASARLIKQRVGWRIGGKRRPPVSGTPILVYLITSDISSILLRGQLDYLRQRGFDVHVGTAINSDLAGQFDDNIPVTHIPFVREPSPQKDVRALWHTYQLLRHLRPTIVNASTPKAGLIGMVAARLRGVPVRVYVVRGLRMETTTGWRRQLYRALECVAVNSATHVLFNSLSLLEVARREGLAPSGRSQIIGVGSGNGISVQRFGDCPARDTARQSCGIPVAAEVIGFVGRLTNDKGVGDVVRVFQEERERRPRLHLLLAGAFEGGDELTLGLRDIIDRDERIIHLPWVEDPRSAYKAMDVLAFASYREGLPNVPLEAQLCGVPVVGYAATGTVDAVRDGHTGVLVRVGDIAALRHGIASLLDDDVRRAHLADAGRFWVASRFSNDAFWAELADCYRDWIPR